MNLTHSKWVAALVASAGAVILAIGLFGATTSFALPDYGVKTGQACGICHVSPGGGGALTPRGQAFAAIATHTSDPAGAFTQSGAAPAAPTAAPKPAATAAPTTPPAAATAAPTAAPKPAATAAPAAPPAAATAAPAATPAALPKTGGEFPLAPLAVGAGVFLSALGLSVRRIFRR